MFVCVYVKINVSMCQDKIDVAFVCTVLKDKILVYVLISICLSVIDIRSSSIAQLTLSLLTLLMYRPYICLF